MEFHGIGHDESQNNIEHWLPENILEIEPQYLVLITEKICKDKKCRYPQLALRILIHVIAGMDTKDRIYICARQLSKTLDANYDTVTKCLKYLREAEILRIGR